MSQSAAGFSVSDIQAQLARDGVVVLPGLIDGSCLSAMQEVFEQALQHPSWNTWMGYEQNERWRLLVENLLVYDRSFYELALHPQINEVIADYIGPDFQLMEARGWETIATKRKFHGWHNDAWYDPALETIPRELKVACYLTDVESGQFQYVKGSHTPAKRPGHWNDKQIETQYADSIENAFGPAGTVVLFDPTGIHRQASPVLTPRRIVMLNYHDPAVPIQKQDKEWGRYRPLLLNAECLGDLGQEQQRVLGFGVKGQLGSWFPKHRRFPSMHRNVQRALTTRVLWLDWWGQVKWFVQAVGKVPRKLKERFSST